MGEDQRSSFRNAVSALSSKPQLALQVLELLMYQALSY
jgi:hypothetical protein